MRIEKRGDVEYLVASFGNELDCTAEFDGWACCYHVDGQHVATGSDYCGAREVFARWPIESAATAGPTQPAHRFLTPDEVRGAQAPHVLAAVERINAELAAGVRWFEVNAPLSEEIKRGLHEAGWTVLGATTANGRTSFMVRERKEGEA